MKTEEQIKEMLEVYHNHLAAALATKRYKYAIHDRACIKILVGILEVSKGKSKFELVKVIMEKLWTYKRDFRSALCENNYEQALFDEACIKVLEWVLR